MFIVMNWILDTGYRTIDVFVFGFVYGGGYCLKWVCNRCVAKFSYIFII